MMIRRTVTRSRWLLFAEGAPVRELARLLAAMRGRRVVVAVVADDEGAACAEARAA